MGEGERKVSFDKRREHVDGKLPGKEAGELEGFKPWQTNAQSHTVCQYCILDGSLSKYPYPQSLTRPETVHIKLLRSRHPPKLYYYSLQFWWRRLLKKIVWHFFSPACQNSVATNFLYQTSHSHILGKILPMENPCANASSTDYNH